MIGKSSTVDHRQTEDYIAKRVLTVEICYISIPAHGIIHPQRLHPISDKALHLSGLVQ